jgi:tRNA threonylcarbamoyladenosine biosynthesis protein TsaE
MIKEFFENLPDEKAMLAFGADLSVACNEAAVIFFYGNLGAGKTTIARGFLRGKGYSGKVKSPTYTLVEPYEIESQKIFHFDLYRIKNPGELEYIGLQDYVSESAICLVEWPQNGLEELLSADLCIHINSFMDGRQVRVEAVSELGQKILEHLATVREKT